MCINELISVSHRCWSLRTGAIWWWNMGTGHCALLWPVMRIEIKTSLKWLWFNNVQIWLLMLKYYYIYILKKTFNLALCCPIVSSSNTKMSFYSFKLAQPTAHCCLLLVVKYQFFSNFYVVWQKSVFSPRYFAILWIHWKNTLKIGFISLCY